MIQTGIISKVKIQDILTNQLPEFIRDESPKTVDFLNQYYVSQEYQGGPANLSDNLEKYLNVDNLTPEVIVDSATTTGITTVGAEIINVSSTKGFPNEYGLLKIDNEIITYTGITTNSFTGCRRGFSGITSYHSDSSKEDLVFSTSSAAEHEESSSIQNLSSLFLKEFYKKFKKTFLPGLEETNFQSKLDVGTFIREARSLYQTKGTNESFRILFNVLYGLSPNILNLEDRLIKPSTASYVRRQVCVAEVLSGNPSRLRGQNLLKGLTGQTLFRSDIDQNINASISEIEPFERVDSGLTGISTYYKIGLFVGYDETSDVQGDFIIIPNTKALEKTEPNSSVLTVDSTIGFGTAGTIVSGTNTISYTDKTVNQFLNCQGIGVTILPVQNVRSDVTYFGYEDGDLDKKVVLRLTGVLSRFEQEGSVDVNEGEIISVKNIGDKVQNDNQNYKEIFCNSWIYNTSSSYFIKSKEGGVFTLSSVIDRSSLKVGDTVDIIEINSNTIIQSDDTIFINEIDLGKNTVTLSSVANISDFDTISNNFRFKLRKRINKPNSTSTPIEFGSNIVSDVQNVYTQGERAYVTSNSLPSYSIDANNNLFKYFDQITASRKLVTLNLADPSEGILSGSTNDEQDFTVIGFGTDAPFLTGDKIFYRPIGGDSLVGLETGSYFVEVLQNKKNIKLYGSPSGIDDGKNLVFSKNINDNLHEFVLFSQRSSEIGAQKLIKEFPLKQNITSGDNDETLVGQTGMLINGVEITNYKSNDKIFFGPLTSVDVLNGGEDFDVVNPPNIKISAGLGTTALVQPVLTGKVEDVIVDPQNFDIDKVVSIGITGGNGSGCILEPVIGSRFRREFFNTSPNTISNPSGGINTITETISFLETHNFVDGEPIIYDSNFTEAIKIVGTGTDRLVNGAIYYPKQTNTTTIELFETFQDYTLNTNKINFAESFGLGNHSFKVGLRNTLLDVKVIDSGSGYTNRKLFVKPTGITTGSNTINFKDHGFSDGDLINYSGNISGLNNNFSYYILKNDDNSFSLSDAGIGGTFFSNYERRKVVNLETSGSGLQTFKYPDIKVFVEFDSVGIGSGVFVDIGATPKVKGSLKQLYLYEPGTGYGSTIVNNHRKPIITLQNGKDASVKPVINNGQIDKVIIGFGGTEYFSTPELEVIDPTGKGIGAELRPVLQNQKITDVIITNAGIGYSTSTSIKVKSSGRNQFINSNVRSLTLNKHKVDDNQHLEESNFKLKYSFTGYSTSPFKDGGDTVSDIIGWAYDGNPIYGPFGYDDPSNSPSNDVGRRRLVSGYQKLPDNIDDRPAGFISGFFIEDYVFTDVGDLDEHNGRFEKTKEFPNGIYAYHATIDSSNNPEFPYFIGNSYRSKKIVFNSETNSQTSFDFNQNLLRNTFPYKVADDFANNDFIVETNEIQDQKIELNSVSSGSVTGFDILFGGSNYKVDEILKFDDSGTNGSGLVAKISELNGKSITNVNTSIEKINDAVLTWNKDKINVFTPVNHNLQPGDFVNISGLSTDISSLNDIFSVGVNTFRTTTISTISSAPVAGFSTEIFVANIPSQISVGSSVGIGSETLKILNIYPNLNILTIERTSGSAYATSHPKGSQVNYISNSFTINKSINEFKSKNNRKLFFNASQTVGLGTDDGTEYNVSFSFADKTITRNIPIKQLYIENHRLKTNQRVTFTKPVGSNIVVSKDNGASTFNMPDSVFVVNKTINTIGIKTGIGTDFNEVHFISLSNGDSDKFLFETNFESVIGDVEKIKTTVSVSTSHNLETNDKINLIVKPNLNIGIGTTAVRVLRDTLTGNILFNPIGFNSTGINTITSSINLTDHGLQTGEKVKYNADKLPDGLQNKNYFVYKIDDDNIKLCDTLIDSSQDIPNFVGIGSTGGQSQSISLINPEIFPTNNNDLVFDLSDNSLSGYQFKLYYDSIFKNEFTSDGQTSNFNLIKVGAALTVGYGNSLPKTLFYNLENSGNISTTDKEVKNSSRISYVDSKYNDIYNVTKINDTSFHVFLKNKPEKLSYTSLECDTLKYTSNSKTINGSISKVDIISGGSNYKKIPTFVGIAGSTTGIDALIIPTSKSIGNVETVRIINEGFEYSSDKTLEPESLIASTVETINSSILGIVSVTNGGADYISAPNIIVIDSITGQQIESGFLEPVMLENSILSVNVNEIPKGLPQDTVKLKTINNTNGITILEVKSNNTGTAFTCKLTTPTPQFSVDPFAVNDLVFVEGIEKLTGTGSGFNSSDYGYNFLRVSGFNANVSGFAEVTIDVSEFTTATGVAKTEVSTYATVIQKNDYPEFFVTQNQSEFEKNENLIINNSQSDLEVVGLNNGKLKIFGKTNLKIGDIITGSNSGVQAEISKVTENKGRLKTDFSILKDLGWSDDIGKLNEDFQVVSDNDYYQNMSYSVQSPIEWRELRTTVNNLLHTSGMKNFADTGITSTTEIGIGVSENVSIIVDLFDERRVDELLIDTGRDVDVIDNVSRKISFDNVKLSNFVSCKTNDVLLIDDIDKQFSNLEGDPDEFLDIFEFNSNEIYNNLLVQTSSTTSSGANELQLSEILLLSNGTKNLFLNKSNLINSGIGLTSNEDDQFVSFVLNKDPITSKTTLRFIPVRDPINIDYDLKILSSNITSSTSGVGTTSIGPINLTSDIRICSSGISTNLISVPLAKFESLHLTVHVIDLVTNEMNLVENLVTHTNTDTFLAQAYINSDESVLSLNQIGIITSGISGNNLVVSFNNNTSNNIKLKSKIIGIGTIGESDEIYRFKSVGQVDGSERSANIAGFSTVNVGISTIIDFDSQLFNSIKSVVEVSIGSSKAIHEVLAIHDGTDAFVTQSGSLSVTKDFVSEYDPSSGLGTFSASYSASKFKLLFHPDDVSGVSTVVSYNNVFYSVQDTINTPEILNYGGIDEKIENEQYNAVNGNRVNRKEFVVENNSIPLYGKEFNPSDTTKLDLTTGKFTIANHFFRENEELVYKPGSTFIGIGSTPMQFKNGSIVDSLPTTVFAKTVDSNSFFISTTRAGTAVTFMGIGEGNNHELSMANSNEKSLINIDNITQYPLIETNVTHNLENNLSGQVGLTTTIINLSGISTIGVNDIIKIENEFVKVTNVGFATTSGSPVGTSGTFNTIEVERAAVGSEQTTHNDGIQIKRFKGQYNIVGTKIFFVDAPRGNPDKTKDEGNLDTPKASFNGRVYLRNDYSTNQIFDDISDQFTGITTTFTLKVGGANTVGLGTTGGNGILFVNGIFQSPSTDNNPDKNFKIIESGSGATGVTSVFFTGITSSDGNPFISNNNINTNELPRGGIPVSFGSTVTGLGYAPLVGAKVKATKDATTGSITGIVGVAFTGSPLGIVTATYNNVTGVITFQTVNEHRFTNSNEVAILDSLQFDPSITLSGNQFPVVSIAATNVFGVNIGIGTTNNAYVGSGNVSPYFSNLTFGSGYNDRVAIAVTVMDLGYEHRFVDADTNSIIGHSAGYNITPTNATYDPVTGILVITANNHGMSTNDLVGIKTGSIRFTCERDNFKTVHPYPRSTDPVAGINTTITKLDNNLLSMFVGVNVGSGAEVTATAGVGGTAIFTVGAAGTNYKDPRVFVSEPSYANLPVTGVSRLSIGSTTETGNNLTVTAVVSASATTGIGSTLFEVSKYEVVNSGYGFEKGDVIEAVGLVTAKGMGAFSPKSTLEVNDIYNDSFAMWQFGEFDYIDSIKRFQDGNVTRFPLNFNNTLISVEASNTLQSSVTIENIFLVIINGIIQNPNESYNIVGGTSINFSEAPEPEDDITILFYRGTGGEDSNTITGQEINIETGDDVRLESSTPSVGGVEIPAQNNRTVTGIVTSTTLETNIYQEQGISENISRPIKLIKQKNDKTINKVIVSKKRSKLEPRIIPVAKIIGDVSTTNTDFFLDNADLFNYEDESTVLIEASITNLNNTTFTNASATATVSSGSVSGITITNNGSGYTSTPTVKLSAPPNIGVGIGTTATATATISNGQISSINITNVGLGYTIAPIVLISSPVSSNVHENLTTSGLTIQENTGLITGIETAMFSFKQALKFTIKRDGSNFIPLGIGTPIYIYDTRVGSGLTSLSTSGIDSHTVGIGTTFVDNVYTIASFQDLGSGVGIITCIIKSDTSTTGITSTGSADRPVGRYSIARVKNFTRSTSSPISIGVTGLTVDAGLTTFPTLKRTGGDDTFGKTGGLTTPT